MDWSDERGFILSTIRNKSFVILDTDFFFFAYVGVSYVLVCVSMLVMLALLSVFVHVGYPGYFL